MAESIRDRSDHNLNWQPYFGVELGPGGIDEVQQARLKYLSEHDLIDESAIDETKGGLVDKYSDRSVWLGVRSYENGELQSAGRIILPIDGEISTLQMPLDRIVNPNEELVKILQERPAYDTAEGASLLRLGDDPQANLALYGAFYKISQDRGIKHMLLGLRESNQKRFQGVLGPALVRLGDSVDIEGAKESLLPYLLDLSPAAIDALKKSLEDDTLPEEAKMARALLLRSIDAPVIREDADMSQAA